jgi:hypothetical protein
VSTPPPPRSVPLSSSAQTAYAQLLDAAHAADLARTVADLPVTFARKQVKGRTYGYYQVLDVAGRQRQIYVGPENDRVLALVERRGADRARPALQGLARSAIALGNAPMLPSTSRSCSGWPITGFPTQAACSSARMPSSPTGTCSASAGPMGLLPLMGASGAGATYFDPKDPESLIDFLTPLHRGGTTPYRLERLGITVQPLKFMEFSLQDVQQAAVFAGSGVAVVNVPHPARFALHKLLVAGERPASRIATSNKDSLQAAALLSVLAETMSEAVRDAWMGLMQRGPLGRTGARMMVVLSRSGKAIPNEVRVEILRRIARAEREQKGRVLLAVESGSRAWGFASPNSEFDARFIYVHRRDSYLAVDLEERRDVIEYPIVDAIDLNGWDLRKALRPLLAARWIEAHGTAAPIEFERLLSMLDDCALLADIDVLPAKKRAAPELGSRRRCRASTASSRRSCSVWSHLRCRSGGRMSRCQPSMPCSTRRSATRRRDPTGCDQGVPSLAISGRSKRHSPSTSGVSKVTLPTTRGRPSSVSVVIRHSPSDVRVWSPSPGLTVERHSGPS